MVLVQSDSLPLSASSCCLMVVPMFHANSWGLIYAAPLVGAKLVLPGPWLDGPNLYNLIESHGVTMSAGVPTVWLGLLAYMEEADLKFSTMKMAGIGGAAAPRSMIEAFEFKHGVDVRHLWGMTELSPLGTIGRPSPAALLALRKAVPPGPNGGPALTPAQEALVRAKVKQGRPHALCDVRIVDDDGRPLPHDGKEVGHLQVKGPATVSRYFKADKPAVDGDGWFSTGDVANVDPYGGVSITDRSKDVIKSGGEWISSIEIENLAQGFPGVREAAVVAIPDERWGERPLLVLVLKHGVEGGDDLKSHVLRFMESKLARFAVPDDVVFVEEIPHNATGKVSKLTLREMFKAHKPPPKARL